MRTGRSWLLLTACLLTTGCSDFYEFFGLKDPVQEDIDRRKLIEWTMSGGNVSQPTIDLVQAAAGTTAPATGDPHIGVGVKTDGGPAPDTVYSNYVEVEVLNVAEQISKSVIRERHDGVDSTIVDNVNQADVTYVRTTWGHFVEFPVPPGWEPGDLVIYIFTGYMETSTSPFLQDESGELPFDDTEPVEDILSEIDAVFVPS